MTTEETPDEEVRLAERARRIWGENPFSPETMAADATTKAAERETLAARQRYEKMHDLTEHEEEN